MPMMRSVSRRVAECEQCPSIDGKRTMPDQSAGRLRQAPGKLAQYFIVNRRAMNLIIVLRDSSWQCPASWILVVAERGVASGAALEEPGAP